MKFRPFALLAFVATVGLVACSDDPTETNNGEPFAIVTTRSETHLAQNAQVAITAYVIDENNRRIPGALTASSAGPAVTVDSAVYIPELAQTLVWTTARADSAAGTDVTISGHNLTTTVKVIVN